MHKIRNFLQSDRNFFTALFVFLLIIFRNAFTINFFLDDFFFLRIGKANSLDEIIKFFSPFKSYFYRPIPTELFYYTIYVLKNNLFFSHLIVFITYFVGLYFAYKSQLLITKNKLWSRLTIALYAISFIHVFQLYQLATFIEIALFTFLSISLYFFLNRKSTQSVLFFVFACMSKETAVLFPIFLVAVNFIQGEDKSKLKNTWIHFVTSIIFLAIFKLGLSSVVNAIDTYTIHMDPRLGINNLMWYSLWSFGLPNFLPVYMTSIFQKPIHEFWEIWKNNDVKIYFALLALYVVSAFSMVASFFYLHRQKITTLLKLALFCAVFFVLFISPTLLIIHKWMVRLMLPLFFLSLLLSYPVSYSIKRKGFARIVGYFFLFSYLCFNIAAITVHESSSLFILESKFVNNLERYFSLHGDEIARHKYIYFIDPKKGTNPWGGSKKLKVTLHDQNFLYNYFPNKNIIAIYGYENKTIPKDAYLIKSIDILTANK